MKCTKSTHVCCSYALIGASENGITTLIHDQNIDFLKAVCASCSKDLNVSLDSDSIRIIENKVFSARNVDGPDAFFANDLEGKNQFALIISKQNFPLLMQGAAQASRHAKTVG